MATTNVNLTDAWTLLVTGPTTVAGTISAWANDAEIAIASSTPASTFRGFQTRPSDPYYFELGTGENLYGRASSPSNVALVILNT